MWRPGLFWCVSGQGQLPGACKGSTERTVSTKCGEISRLDENMLASQEAE